MENTGQVFDEKEIAGAETSVGSEIDDRETEPAIDRDDAAFVVLGSTGAEAFGVCGDAHDGQK